LSRTGMIKPTAIPMVKANGMVFGLKNGRDTKHANKPTMYSISLKIGHSF
jgi:hypothetical protein